jgi:tRNA(adenine34) deaminase
MVPKGRPADVRSMEPDERFMRLALEQARQGLHLGEVPVGAILVLDGDVLASGFNQPIHKLDPSAHAEIIALRRGARALGNYRLAGSTLYVTVEPCLMCVGALLHARVARVVYGCAEPKSGALSSILNVEELPANHRLEVVSGVLESECRKALRDFFQYRREEA